MCYLGLIPQVLQNNLRLARYFKLFNKLKISNHTLKISILIKIILIIILIRKIELLIINFKNQQSYKK